MHQELGPAHLLLLHFLSEVIQRVDIIEQKFARALQGIKMIHSGQICFPKSHPRYR